jgi:hypothetical protein
MRATICVPAAESWNKRKRRGRGMRTTGRGKDNPY